MPFSWTMMSWVLISDIIPSLFLAISLLPMTAHWSTPIGSFLPPLAVIANLIPKTLSIFRSGHGAGALLDVEGASIRLPMVLGSGFGSVSGGGVAGDPADSGKRVSSPGSAASRETRKPSMPRFLRADLLKRPADRQPEAVEASTRPGARGAPLNASPSDRPSVSSRSNSHHTNPDTTPIRSRAYHRAPRHSASSRLPDASFRPSSHRTTHIRPTPTPRPRSNSASCSPPGRHIPIGPRWATRTSRPADFRVQLLHELLAIFPTDLLFHRVLWTLNRRVAAHHRLPLLLRHQVLAQVERLGDPHPVLRLLGVLGVLIRIGRAHQELARRDEHELHANRVGHLDRHAEVLRPRFLVFLGFRCVERGDGEGWRSCPGLRKHVGPGERSGRAGRPSRRGPRGFR